LGRASDLVTCKERFGAVARALLGEVFVYDSSKAASDAFEQGMALACASRVSLDGDLYECWARSARAASRRSALD